MKDRMKCLRVISGLLVPIILLGTGCNLIQPAGDTQATSTPPATTVPTVITPQVTPDQPNSSAPAGTTSSLRVWIPPEIGARTEAGTQELISQLRAYETMQSDLDVIIEQKPIEGPGGVINYLQTGRTVAPSVMPDIVAVPTSLLADSRYHGLFYPLDSLLDPAFKDDIYPAPAGQALNGDQILGYPFATTGLTHLIFNPDVITGTIPLSWSQLISDTNKSLILPADSREGAMLGLQFYLAEGGTLIDSNGKVVLEPEPLARALTLIGNRKENLLQSHQLKTLDEAWQYHQLGLSDFMWIRSDYLLGRQELDPTLSENQGFTAVPGVSGALAPLTTSWAWAVTTSDPARQKIAADLMGFLTTPENIASWSSRSQFLPASRSAVELLARDNPYYLFINEELQRANPMMVAETSKVMDVLGGAVFQALTTENPPSQIAEEAAAALRQ